MKRDPSHHRIVEIKSLPGPNLCPRLRGVKFVHLEQGDRGQLVWRYVERLTRCDHRGPIAIADVIVCTGGESSGGHQHAGDATNVGTFPMPAQDDGLEVCIPQSAAAADGSLGTGAQRIVGDRYGCRARESGIAKRRYLLAARPQDSIHVQQHCLLSRGKYFTVPSHLLIAGVKQEAVVVGESRSSADAGIDSTQAERIDAAVLRVCAGRDQPGANGKQDPAPPLSSWHSGSLSGCSSPGAHCPGARPSATARRRKPSNAAYL